MSLVDEFFVGIEQYSPDYPFGTPVVIVVLAGEGEAGRRKLKPKIVYIEEKVAVELKKFGVLTPYGIELPLEGLSVIKLERMLVLLEEFNVVIPSELRLFLSDLTILTKREKELTIAGLSVVRKEEIIKELNNLSFKYYAGKQSAGVLLNKFSLDQKKILEKTDILVQLNTLNLAKRIKKQIYLNIPNIYALKWKERLKYLELMDILDKLNEE